MIKNFFENDINRNIETVIIADDLDHISDEVAEYVVTSESAKKIEPYFLNTKITLEPPCNSRVVPFFNPSHWVI